MKGWKQVILVGGLSAAAVFAAASFALGAGGADRGPLSGVAGGGMMVAAARDPVGQADRGCGGAALMTDRQARDDMRALRDEHRAEMREWWEKYGDDPSADDAQGALEQLRAHHADEMRDLFDKYGVQPPAGLGEGRPGGCGLGGAAAANGPGGCGLGGAGAANGPGGCGGVGWGGGSGMTGDPTSAAVGGL